MGQYAGPGVRSLVFFLAVKRFAGAFSNFCLFVSMSRELIYPGNCVGADIFFKKKKKFGSYYNTR